MSFEISCIVKPEIFMEAWTRGDRIMKVRQSGLKLLDELIKLTEV